MSRVRSGCRVVFLGAPRPQRSHLHLQESGEEPNRLEGYVILSICLSIYVIFIYIYIYVYIYIDIGVYTIFDIEFIVRLFYCLLILYRITTTTLAARGLTYRAPSHATSPRVRARNSLSSALKTPSATNFLFLDTCCRVWDAGRPRRSRLNSSVYSSTRQPKTCFRRVHGQTAPLARIQNTAVVLTPSSTNETNADVNFLYLCCKA